MKLWKRNAVVAAIVLFVCAAVYLNWSYNQTESVSADEGITTGKTLGEAELVGSETELTLTGGDSESTMGETDAVEAGDTVDTVSSDEDDYFAAARLNREEARSSALSILQDTVNDPEANSEAVSAATESITAMAAATLQESEIENLVTAKGYSDCVAFIGDSSVSVVVAPASGSLEAGDIARITDIVCGETAFTASNVKVIEAGE